MRTSITSQLIEDCGGIETVITEHRNHSGDKYDRRSYHKIGDIVVPDNVYIKIIATATKGTIGKLVDLELDVYGPDDQVSEWGMTYIIQVEGKEGTNRIAQYHSDIIKDHDGSTKWVRNIKKHNKEEIPVHINKYKQPLNKGEWVAGLGPGKVLHFGQLTRWSKSSIWVNPTPSVPKSKENCISYTKETLVLPAGIDYEQVVTMMALSGWRR